MSDEIVFHVQPRERAGTGGARAVRRQGRIPAIVYGGDRPPEMISINFNEFQRAVVRNPRLMSSVVVLERPDGSRERVLPREVQLHPVTDLPLHIDFLRAARGARIEVEVPVEFVNEDKCPGLRQGGVLNIVRREIEVECPVDAIPEKIVVDLSGFEIGDSVHISHVKLPPGVEPTIRDRDFTICVIVPPTVAVEGAGEAAGEEAGEEAE